MTLYAHWDLDSALEAFRKSLSIYQEKASKSNKKYQKDIAICRANIGSVLVSKGNLKEGLEEIQNARMLLESISGSKKDKMTADLLYLHGCALFEAGEIVRAEAKGRRAMQLYQQLLWEEHPRVADCLDLIAKTMIQINTSSLQQACEFHQKACNIREIAYGVNHATTAQSYIGLGIIQALEGYLGDALEEIRKGLGIQEEEHGKDHPITASTYHTLGNVYYHRCDYGSALEQYRSALAIRERILGINHLHTAASHHNLGCALARCGKPEDAMVEFVKALSVRESRLGPDDTRTRQTKWAIEAVGQGKAVHPPDILG